MSNPFRLSGRTVIATHNQGKLREMIDLLGPYGVEPVSAAALNLPEPVENGTLYAENAAIKALAAARATGLPALSDDSGLAIHALDGAPGIFTADWAGKPADYPGAMERIRQELIARDVEPEGAKAHFVSALVVALPDGRTLIAEGRVFGTLTFPPRGTLGFGYDPIFLPDGHHKTFGEMRAEEKHGLSREDGRLTGLSHRARAFIKLLTKTGMLAQAEASSATAGEAK